MFQVLSRLPSTYLSATTVSPAEGEITSSELATPSMPAAKATKAVRPILPISVQKREEGEEARLLQVLAWCSRESGEGRVWAMGTAWGNLKQERV